MGFMEELSFFYLLEELLVVKYAPLNQYGENKILYGGTSFIYLVVIIPYILSTIVLCDG